MLVKLVLPEWRNRKVADIMPPDVDRLLNKISAGRARPSTKKHTQIGTTQRYAHLIDAPLRDGVSAVGELLKPRLRVVGEGEATGSRSNVA